MSLQKVIHKPPAIEFPHNYWIYEETCKFINSRVSLRCSPDRDQIRILNLGRRLKAILNREWWRRAEEAVMAVNSMLTSDPPLIKEGWLQIKVWYKTATNRPPPASRYTRLKQSGRHSTGGCPPPGIESQCRLNPSQLTNTSQWWMILGGRCAVYGDTYWWGLR